MVENVVENGQIWLWMYCPWVACEFKEKLGIVPKFVVWLIGWTMYYSPSIIYQNEKAWKEKF